VATSLKEIVDDHLRYEVAMLFAIYNRLAEGISDYVVRTALIEAFGIHVRVLNDFLLSTGNGLHAKVVTTGYKPTVGGIDWPIIKNISKQIAHLDKKRTSASLIISSATRRKIVKALAEELIALHRHWRPQYAARWYVEAADDGYALHRPGRQTIVLRLK
jgi:hypothetical protein